jgi:uncharacterized protein YcnI
MAHIVANPNEGESGAWFRTNLMVSHGCEGGSDTTKITVTIPKEILVIKPQAKAGWKIDIVKHKLAKPVQGPHGKMITEVTDKISWTGHLEDAYFDEFGLNMKLPEGTKTIYLPTLQECVKGSHDWKDIPMDDMEGMEHMHHDDKASPAPSIKIAPKK